MRSIHRLLQPERLGRLLARIAWIAFGLLHFPATYAQDAAPPSSDAATWSFQWENDLFAKDRNDRYYTNGLRLLYARPAWRLSDAKADSFIERYGTLTGNWLCHWSNCDERRANVVVDTHGGQNMYTPQNLRSEAPNPFDRPYAGWLYLGQRTRVFDRPDKDDEATRMQTLDVSVGVVGPSAGAGKVQEEWHHLLNAVDPKGWPTQLRNEPGVLVIYTVNYRKELGALMDTLPYWRISAGNVLTSAAVGTQFRFGKDLSGFGHFDPVPAMMVTPMSATDLREKRDTTKTAPKGSPLYMFLALEGRAVARNIFIDGNTWRDYPSTSYISRKPFVGDFTLGFSAKVSKGTRITYGHTWRTREFANDRTPPFGTPRSETQRYGVVQIQWED